jgi:hypothetical protein
MKTRIRKVIIIAAALLFVSSGVALAQGRNFRHGTYDKRWNALGHFKKAPAGRSYRIKNNYDGRRDFGHAKRHFYQRQYHPKKYHPRHPYCRHPKQYPSWNHFSFGFSLR